MERKSSTRNWPLIAVLALAAALRLVDVTQPYVDAFSWRQAETALVTRELEQDPGNHLRLYVAPPCGAGGAAPRGWEFHTVAHVAALLRGAMGPHDWVGRSVGVAFGVWGVFALYRLVARVWGDRRHATAAALMLAVLPGAVFIDRSFLPDPAVVALSTTAAWLLVAHLQDGRLRYLVLAAACFMLAMLTKLPAVAVLVPMAYAAWAVLRRGRDGFTARRVTAVVAAAAVALAAVAAYFLWMRHLARLHPTELAGGLGDWLTSASKAADWRARHWFLRALADKLTYWMWTEPVIALVIVGMFCRPPARPNAAAAPWFFHAWLVGFAGMYLVGAGHFTGDPSGLHILSPAAAALAGRALMAVIAAPPVAPLRSPVTLAAAASVLLAVGWWGWASLGRMYHGRSQDSYEMGRALARLAAPSDRVVAVADSVGDPLAVYYSGRAGWVFPPPDMQRGWTRLPADDAESVRLLEELRNNGARWFGVVAARHEELRLDHPRFARHLEGNAELAEADPRYVIYRLRMPASSPGGDEP